MARKVTPAQLKKKLWVVFSKYIRTRDNYTCVSCGKKGDPKYMHAGHYVPRSKGLALYFDERNVNAQCYHCNINLFGNAAGYTIFLQKKYGPEIVETLERESRAIKKYSLLDYLDLIQIYEDKVKELETLK